LRSLAPLLAAIAITLAVSMSAILAGSEEASIDGKISHFGFYVKARSFERVEFYASVGTTVKVIAYIVDSAGNPIDIDVQIIRPDGSLEYPKERVSGVFRYAFEARMSGTYTVVFDNTYSILTDKYVDLAIAGFPQPQTVTVIRTLERAVTLTETKTETVTTTVEAVPGTAIAWLAVIVLAALVAILALLLRRR